VLEKMPWKFKKGNYRYKMENCRKSYESKVEKMKMSTKSHIVSLFSYIYYLLIKTLEWLKFVINVVFTDKISGSEKWRLLL